MSRNVPQPKFPNPPAQYEQRYFADFIRAFALYQQQVQNAGEGRHTTLVLTNLPTSTTGLESGSVWNDAGVLKIVP